jgi:hypothetical protein
MSFSHSADFNQIFLLIRYIMISQEEGQGRTTPMLRNSWDKDAFFLQGGACPQRLRRGEIFLDNSGVPGKIVTVEMPFAPIQRSLILWPRLNVRESQMFHPRG